MAAEETKEKKTKEEKPAPAEAKATADKKKPAAKKTAAKKTSAKKAAKGKKAGEVSKLRIRVRAYEHKILDASIKQIMDTALRYDAKVVGPTPLPTEIKKYTVNRAAFVYKDAREQFEMRVHKRMIDILNPDPKVVEALTNLSLPSGVNIDVKMT
jgi:small subunit ribosomal protein S10